MNFDLNYWGVATNTVISTLALFGIELTDVLEAEI